MNYCKECLHYGLCYHHCPVYEDEEMFWCSDYVSNNNYINVPFSVGDTIYKIVMDGCYDSNWEPFVEELWVTEFSCKFIRGKPEWGFVAERKTGFKRSSNRYSLRSFNKTIFLTKERAEEELAKKSK